MQKNIFICHRPYHILRCCDIINRKYQSDCYNVLITFDVKIAGRQSYQRIKTNEIFFPAFNEVIEYGIGQIPSIKRPIYFNRYCKQRKKEFQTCVSKHSDTDSLFFFSDVEVDVELLVGLFINNKQKDILSVLVDEGTATYSTFTHHATRKFKLYSRVVSRLMGLRFFNWEWKYGGSYLYNYSIANIPEKAFFRPPVEKLPVLSEELCARYRNILMNTKTIDENKPYFIYVSAYYISFEREVSVIKQTVSMLNRFNVAFYIKPHPLQDETLYEPYPFDDYILEKGYPIELFYGKNAIIGGYNSSALYNAALQGCRVIDMSPLLGSTEESEGPFPIPVAGSFESFEKLIQDTINSKALS